MFRHVDLWRQQARCFDLTIEQRFQPRAEAARIDSLDVLERQIFFQTVGYVEMAPSTHADRDRHVFQVFWLPDFGLRPHEDCPGRIAIAFGNDAAHAGAGVADRAPDAGALDHVLFFFGIGPVLRPLEIFEPFQLDCVPRNVFQSNSTSSPSAAKKPSCFATKSLRPMPLGATLTRFRLLAIANLLDH